MDINAITNGLVSFLDKVIGKDIELKVITASIDLVKADPTQLEQVLMNLCLHARDAMPKEGRLQIYIQERARTEKELHFPIDLFDFLPLTPAFCGATNRRKTSSLVVSLLTNCKTNRE